MRDGICEHHIAIDVNRHTVRALESGFESRSPLVQSKRCERQIRPDDRTDDTLGERVAGAVR